MVKSIISSSTHSRILHNCKTKCAFVREIKINLVKAGTGENKALYIHLRILHLERMGLPQREQLAKVLDSIHYSRLLKFAQPQKF